MQLWLFWSPLQDLPSQWLSGARGIAAFLWLPPHSSVYWKIDLHRLCTFVFHNTTAENVHFLSMSCPEGHPNKWGRYIHRSFSLLFVFVPSCVVCRLVYLKFWILLGGSAAVNGVSTPLACCCTAITGAENWNTPMTTCRWWHFFTKLKHAWAVNGNFKKAEWLFKQGCCSNKWSSSWRLRSYVNGREPIMSRHAPVFASRQSFAESLTSSENVAFHRMLILSFTTPYALIKTTKDSSSVWIGFHPYFITITSLINCGSGDSIVSEDWSSIILNNHHRQDINQSTICLIHS